MNQLIVAGKYAVLKRLAAGGMAELFLARQFGIDGFEKLVVLKRILPHLARRKEYVQMFLDEARIVADLHHSNIVTTFEVCEDKGMYFMVMEYLDGQDLRHIFHKFKETCDENSEIFATGIVMDLCAGLHYAHTKKNLKSEILGIVHRDVSPQNIIITYDGVPKIFDFGIAKANHQTWQTRSGVLKGKYSYMSPEQALALTVDARSDVFSLGIILYELTTLTRLFQRNNEVLTCKAIIECDIVHPQEAKPGYQEELAAIVLKALALRPDDRFSSAEEFRRALEQYQQHKNWNYSTHKLSGFLKKSFAEEWHKSVTDRASHANVNLKNDFWGATHTQSSAMIESSLSMVKTTKKLEPKLLIIAVFGACLGLLIALYFVVGVKQPLLEKNAAKSLAVDFQQFKKANEKIPEAPVSKIVSQIVEKKTGRLKIVVHPWATVSLNGKTIGTTPLAAIELVEGNHLLVLENETLKKKVTQNIMIKNGQDTLIKYRW